MSKLSLGPLPKHKPVRLTVMLPAQVKADLDRYAQLYSDAYGEGVDAAALGAHMIAAFMERDRAFRRGRQGAPAASAESSPPASMTSATSNATDTSGEGSSSR